MAPATFIFRGGAGAMAVSVTRPDFIYGAAKLCAEHIGLFKRRES